MLFLMVFVPLGVSVFTASAAMFASALFRRWLAGLGLVAGGLGTVGSIMQTCHWREVGTLRTVGAGLTDAGVFDFWIWLIATSIGLWRHAGPGDLYTPHSAGHTGIGENSTVIQQVVRERS